MKQNFQKSLARVLKHEGGYVNHPRDPGGATNKGITQAVYNAYRKLNKKSLESVRFISDTDVRQIYKRQYWDKVSGDKLPPGLDYAVFDYAVNSGVSRAVKYLQAQLGVAQDGVIGLMTLNAIGKQTDGLTVLVEFIRTYCENRVSFLRRLKTFTTFGKGWLRRVQGSRAGMQFNDDGVLDIAIQMTMNDNI